MQLFTHILDEAVASKRQVHITVRHMYMNVILDKAPSGIYASHFTSGKYEQNCGVNFRVCDVDEILVKVGTDNLPCLDVKLKLFK